MTSTPVYVWTAVAVSCPWKCSCAVRRGCTLFPMSPALWQTARTSASTPRSHIATVIPTTGNCSSSNQSSLHSRNKRERERGTERKRPTRPETLHSTHIITAVLSQLPHCTYTVHCQLSTEHYILKLTLNELYIKILPFTKPLCLKSPECYFSLMSNWTPLPKQTSVPQ